MSLGDSRSWAGSMFGRIFSGDTELELGAGLKFASGLTAVLNTETLLIEVTASGDSLLPVPDDPGDDGKVVVADGGAYILSAPSGGGHAIEDEGVLVTERDTINFVGVNVTAADVGGKIVVTIGAVDLVSGVTGLLPVASIAPGTANRVLQTDSVDTFYALVSLTASVSGQLPFANIANGSALSVFGVTGSSAGVMASITGTANQVLRVNSAGNALAFGAINAQSSAAIVPDFGSQDVLTTGDIYSDQVSDDAVGPRVGGRKARVGPAALDAGDAIQDFFARAYDGSSYADQGVLRFYSYVDAESERTTGVQTWLHDSVALVKVSDTVRRRVTVTSATPVVVWSVTLPDNSNLDVNIMVELYESGTPANRLIRKFNVFGVNDGTSTIEDETDVLIHSNGTEDWAITCAFNGDVFEVRVDSGETPDTVVAHVTVTYAITTGS